MRGNTIKRISQESLDGKISNNYLATKVDQIPLFQRLMPLPWGLWPPEARLLLALLLFWSIAGLFILGSASWWMASKEMGDGSYFVKRQLLWLISGWTIAWLTISINIRQWLKISRFCFFFCILLVGATLVFGSTINGASRWLIIGAIRIQPSELVKPFLILQAANLFAQWKRVQSGQKLLTLSLRNQ